MTSHLSANLFELFGGLRQKLMEGSPIQELQDFSDALISASLLAKGAAVQTTDPSKIITQEAQWVFPDIQKLVEESLDLGFSELMIEWSLLLARDKKVLPANLLVPIMRHFSKLPELAVYVVASLGPRGISLAKHFDEFTLFDPRKWNDPLAYKQRAQRKFAFALFLNLDPEKAVHFLLERCSKMHDEDRKNFLDLVIRNMKPGDITLLDFLSREKSQLMQVYFARLCLLLKPDVYQTNLHQLQIFFEKGGLKEFQLQGPNDRKFMWPPDLVWSSIPPDMISELHQDFNFFEYIHEQQLESSFLNSFKLYPKAKLKVNYFKWLNHKKFLKEDFPMEKLTQGMEYKSFNECCVEWLETQKGKTDMEAFYKASLHHRHYWSDDLCKTIVSLGKLPDILKKFEMAVFWQMMAFKMNPFSEFTDKLPDECRFRMSDSLNFEQVIRFRRFIRKLEKG